MKKSRIEVYHARGTYKGSAGGSDTQVQFNDGGDLAGKAGLTFNKTTDQLDVPGEIHVQADQWVILDA